MRVVVIADWFSEKMGYAENCLPKALASLGAEVHLVTSDAQVYFDSPSYGETYEPFIGPAVVECVVKELDGYTLHRLPHGRTTGRLWPGRLYIKHLVKTLGELKPDIVQTFDVACPTTYHAAVGRSFLHYKLFLEAHCHASVFTPLVRRKGLKACIRHAAIDACNALSSAASVKCYPISSDAADLAVRYFGVQSNKIDICSLGVDTDLFKPPVEAMAQAERRAVRERLGFAASDIVCVYTGRLTPDKGPLVLAQAIDKLVARGAPFRGLFVGAGTSADVAAIAACAGCVIHPFVPVRDLPQYYWAGDLGIWPKQESTSQLDAAACGLPLILSNRIEVRERVEGNGLLYEEGNSDALASTIDQLRAPGIRRQMAEIGAQRVRDQFSWTLIARNRLADYQAAMRS